MIKERITKATDTFLEIILYYVAIIFSSSILFAFFEGKTFLEALWWAGVTAMTVGYGDLYPITVGGKILALLLMHIVPLIIVPLVVSKFLAQATIDRNEFAHEEQEELKSDIKAIKEHLGVVNDKA